MSTVFVHVGQAGCQLGQALWPALAAERLGSPDIFGFRAAKGAAYSPRAVLVDSEPKVVESLLSGAGVCGYAFDPASTATAQSGRGGNFALGYNGGFGDLGAGVGSSDQRQLGARAMECTRRQIEGCHGSHLGTILAHSLGGGTGSGLGSRLVEELRDAYPRSPLLVASVLPISTGENPMQCYNALLALSALQELADGVLLYENDWLLSCAEGRSGAAAQSGSSSSSATVDSGDGYWNRGASLSSMNAIVARDLVPVLCPAASVQPFEPGELLSSVFPMATHKFAQAFSGEVLGQHGPPEMKPVLDSLTKAAPRCLRNSANVLSAHAVLRGVPQQVGSGAAFQADLLERLGGPVLWQPFAADIRCSPTPLRSAPSAARLSVVVNWKRTSQVLRAVHERARQKYASRMFAHWYDCYNFGPDAFAQAFEVIDDVIGNYEAS
ncbi:unnamed protein product [Polarella glacialis]|uniref:Tubulin/FtsZ GTPase domain-containing protein n=1 Tax=Polarella glacialis TaxID=89957 RepID=A0A813D6F7_POLGL|nr:unnamed protein product [Polarella glacialis]CAE8582058.1 unnamed protein product [Polarella glacialis]CAE8655264.1 unnamed protein product [Polarella glacialis]CAE8676578.1 unnamed protein product [Polarella glacialis]